MNAEKDSIDTYEKRRNPKKTANLLLKLVMITIVKETNKNNALAAHSPLRARPKAWSDVP